MRYFRRHHCPAVDRYSEHPTCNFEYVRAQKRTPARARGREEVYRSNRKKTKLKIKTHANLRCYKRLSTYTSSTRLLILVFAGHCQSIMSKYS